MSFYFDASASLHLGWISQLACLLTSCPSAESNSPYFEDGQPVAVAVYLVLYPELQRVRSFSVPTVRLASFVNKAAKGEMLLFGE